METREKTMNILLSCDDRIAKYIPTLMASLYENHVGIKVRIFLMHTKIPAGIVDTIKKFATGYRQEVVEVIADNEDFEMFKRVDPKRLHLFPVEAYYHFLAHKYLPKDVERCLYLDVDTICDSSVYEWYNTDFADMFFITSTKYKHNSGFFAFNSGVFLLNLEKFRAENIGAEFYLRRIEALEKEKTELMGDQEFIGYAFREFKENGIRQVPNAAINFRIQWNLYGKRECDKKPEIQIAHYITNVAKAWQFHFDESFLHLYLGRFVEEKFNYDCQVITENALWVFNLFWKYAKKAPFYEEIKKQADITTAELKRLSGIRTRERKFETLLKSLEIKEKYHGGYLVYPQAAYNDYNMIVTQKDNCTEYKTLYYIKDQWIVFPLKRMLKKGEKLVVKLKCEYRTDNRIYFFLSDYNLKTQHLPAILLEDYCGELTANADGYQFLCFSSNSFQKKDDFIRFFEMEISLEAKEKVKFGQKI